MDEILNVVFLVLGMMLYIIVMPRVKKFYDMPNIEPTTRGRLIFVGVIIAVWLITLFLLWLLASVFGTIQSLILPISLFIGFGLGLPGTYIFLHKRGLLYL
ncbi:MAG: hypothetical protein HC828_08230 [Blastochloris sp.]|nr:hypothetical protein [Blastochloris sp.]